jgi:putative phosphoesterase
VLIGAISDVHSNVDALQEALAALDGKVDEIWCAGDIVLQYRFSNEAVAALRAVGAIAVQGNHDMVLVSDAGAGARARPGIEAGAVDWLGSLPVSHSVNIDGCRVLMTHGSPWAPHGDYVRAHDDRWKHADDLGADIVIVGHTHEPMVATFGSTLVVNPGSVGEPRQRDDRRGTYAIVDTVTRHATIERLSTR